MGLGILCSGQGFQTPQMFDHLRSLGAELSLLDDVARILGIEPASLEGDIDGVDITANHIAQPLLAAYALTAGRLLSDHLPAPLVFAGYSLGEVVSYGCAGALAETDVLALAAARAEAMDDAVVRPQGMIALTGCAMERAEALAKAHGCHIAIVNGPDHVVLGGEAERVAAVAEAAEASEVRHARRLSVHVASHTPLMAGAVKRFRDVLGSYPFSPLQTPVIAGVDGGIVRTQVQAVAALTAQLDHPIHWAIALEAARSTGVSVFLELGPGRALTKMLEEACPEVAARAFEDFRTMEGLKRWIERHLE